MRRSDRAMVGLLVASIVFVVLVIVGAIVFGIAQSGHVQYQTCTVESKDRTTNSKGHSDARVYTTDCGVLKVADSLREGDWHSADIYASIQPGHRYDFKTRGYRVPLLSEFPNIVEANPA